MPEAQTMSGSDVIKALYADHTDGSEIPVTMSLSSLIELFGKWALPPWPNAAGDNVLGGDVDCAALSEQILDDLGKIVAEAHDTSLLIRAAGLLDLIRAEGSPVEIPSHVAEQIEAWQTDLRATLPMPDFGPFYNAEPWVSDDGSVSELVHIRVDFPTTRDPAAQVPVWAFTENRWVESTVATRLLRRPTAGELWSLSTAATPPPYEGSAP